MAENFSFLKPFGMNVAPKNAPVQPKIKEPSVNINETVSNIFDSMTSYIADNEDVFNGNVAHQINMYSRQSMIVGMNMKAADTNVHRFDMNI